MSTKRSLMPAAAVVLALFTTVLFAEQKSWIEKWLPKGGTDEKPGINAPAKPPVEPAPEVLSLQNSFATVVEHVKPAVVNISAVQIAKVQSNPHEFFFGEPDPEEFFRRFFGEESPQPRRRQHPAPAEMRQEATGSGVIIDKDGLVLTNNHVVQGADQLTVTMADGKSYKGKVVGTDPRTDIAVIRIKAAGDLPYATLGDSSQTKIGDWVLAFGSPFGLEQTVTAGIISAIRQSLNIEGRMFRNLLQTDAAINRGNSGGPLVNIRGEVVGINTAIYAPTGVFAGIGFAIPVNDAKAILKDLVEKGHVERSWMGVEIAEVNEVIAKEFGLGKPEGALVNQVVKDSPADKAGLQRGDIIVDFNGQKIKSVEQLQDIVGATPPGKTVKIVAMREGKKQNVTLKTTIMPAQTAEGEEEEAAPEEEESEQRAPRTTDLLGARVANLTPRARESIGIPESVKSGVVVVEVPADSAAAEAGLVEGDVIQEINRTAVKNVADAERVAKSVDPKKGFVLDVNRKGRSFYLSYQTAQ